MTQFHRFMVRKVLLSVLVTTAVSAIPAIAQVTISYAQPLSDQTYTSPVTVSAQASSPQGISGWQVYFGNTLYYQSTRGLDGNLDVNVPSVPPGTYQLTITAFDNSGNHSSYSAQNVTVAASPLSLHEFPNVQNLASGWTECPGTCPGGSGQGTSNLTQNVASTSLSGSSMAEYSASNAGTSFNTLYYNHLGCPDNDNCTSIHNMLLDLWFLAAPSPSNGIEQLEFDPGLYINAAGTGWKLFGSVGCRVIADPNGGAADWYVWDSANAQWVDTQSSCSIAAGQWHHLQLQVAYNTSGAGCNIGSGAPCYTYQTLAFDGTTVDLQNLPNEGQYSALNTGSAVTPTVNVEQQIDNDWGTTQNVANTVYYDNDNLFVW